MNSNQKIKIQTKIVLTDDVIVDDILRQGKPLSGPEFACSNDELNWFGNKVSISNHCIIIIPGWHICNCRKWKRAEENDPGKWKFFKEMAVKSQPK